MVTGFAEMRNHCVKASPGAFPSVQRGRAHSNRVELKGLISIDSGIVDPIVLFNTFSVSHTFTSG